jgi:hypothetical protein
MGHQFDNRCKINLYFSISSNSLTWIIHKFLPKPVFCKVIFYGRIIKWQDNFYERKSSQTLQHKIKALPAVSRLSFSG